MDNDSGESTKEDEVAGVGRDESELEWLSVVKVIWQIIIPTGGKKWQMRDLL